MGEPIIYQLLAGQNNVIRLGDLELNEVKLRLLPYDFIRRRGEA
jgi:hypothetical protein